MRNSAERIRDAIEAIERISRKTSGGKAAFAADELLQVWVLHHLQIIGEACRALPEDIRDRYPAIPWSRIIGMRHVLVHHYFAIDVEVAWEAVANELLPLKEKLRAALEQLGEM